MLNSVLTLIAVQALFTAYHFYVAHRGYSCYSFQSLRSVFFYLPLVLVLAASGKFHFSLVFIYAFFAIEYALSINVAHSLWQLFQFYILKREVPLVSHTPIPVSVRIFVKSLMSDFNNLEVLVNRFVNKMPLFDKENGDMAVNGEGMPLEFKLFQLGYIQEITFLILFLGLSSFIQN